MDATYGILGRTALRIKGRIEEDWGTPRLRAVVASLLIYAGRPMPVDTLIEWVWPEETPIPQNPIPTFHTYATRIRRSLQRADVPAALIVERGSYRLDVDRSTIDYHLFRSLVSDARAFRRQGHTRRTSDLVQRAIGLWRGRPLEDMRTARAEDWRHRILVDEWIPANVMLLEVLLELGELDHALARLDDLQSEHPAELALTELRLAVLHGLARYSDETAHYLTMRRRLLADSDEQAAEHLRQRHEGLIRVQPSIAAAASPQPESVVPRQLPHDAADFVGRKACLSALDAASTNDAGNLTPGAIVVDGMAGVGKTALTVHWAHRERHRFPDGDLYLDLGGFSGGAPVAASTVVDDFLIALGHPPEGNVTRRSRELLLSRLLAERSTLVILDNVRDSAHIKDLVPLLAGSLVILTSRQRLDTLVTTTGARRVHVGPLNEAESTDLLFRRIGASRQIDDRVRARISSMCGGLPLLISIFAEHVATWSDAQLSQFAEQLDTQQLVFQVGESGDGPANAHAFFNWSYQALVSAERHLFRSLGLHPGADVSVDAACACDGRNRAETSKSLAVLVSAHLLNQPDAFDRYRFHDLLKVFAAHCANSEEPLLERRATERRIVSFYLASATNADRILYPARLPAPTLPTEPDITPATFADTADAQAWLDRERTNLVAVIRFAADHGHHDHTWRLADTVASFFDRRGYYEDSRTVRELAVSSTHIAGLYEWEASSQVGLGMVHMILGDHIQARYCFNAALRFAEDNGNERGQASALHQLARLEMLRGDPIAAIGLYRRCLNIAQRLDDHEALCWTHCRIGESLRITDQHDQALVHLHQAQWFAQRIGEQSAHAVTLAEIGSVYRDRGEHDTAAGHCEHALRIAESISDLGATAQICTALAEINHARNDTTAAIAYARRAITVFHQIHDVTGEARAHEVLGDIHFADGEPHCAVVTWEHAANLYDHTDNSHKTSAVRNKINNAPNLTVNLPNARSDPTPTDCRHAFNPDPIKSTTQRQS